MEDFKPSRVFCNAFENIFTYILDNTRWTYRLIAKSLHFPKGKCLMKSQKSESRESENIRQSFGLLALLLSAQPWRLLFGGFCDTLKLIDI